MLSRRHLLAAMLAGVALPTFARERVSVVTTTGMIADVARQVGGEHVDVRALMGPGVDPHAYRQTRSDIVTLAGADLVLWHGLYLEAQIEAFLKRLSRSSHVVALAQQVPIKYLLAHDTYSDKFDPHVWMDPDLWYHVVVAARDALTDLRPELTAEFMANAERHLAELKTLRTYMSETLASVPRESRVLVTAHDAFGYFGRAFGFDVVGIQGISTESEAGLNRISELVEMLVTRNVRAVFVESSVSDRNIGALIEGAAARGHEVRIGGELYSDAMGAEGSYEGTYLGMIDHNATVISRALGGNAPGGGMAGRLAGI